MLFNINNKRNTNFFFHFFLWFFICIKLHFINYFLQFTSFLDIAIHYVAHIEITEYHFNWTRWLMYGFQCSWWAYDVPVFGSITNFSLLYKWPIIVYWNKENSLIPLTIYHSVVEMAYQSYSYLSSNNIQIFVSKLILFHHFIWLGQCFIFPKSVSDSS